MKKAVIYILATIAVIAFLAAIGAVGAFETGNISAGTCVVLAAVRLGVAVTCAAVGGMLAERSEDEA